jgi:hypothetical protein
MRSKLLISLAIVVSTAAVAGVVVWRKTAGTPAKAPQVQGQTVVSASQASVVGQKLPSTQTPAQFPGGIDLTLQGDAEMLLIDPTGRRTGSDPLSNRSFAENPDASAGDDSIDDPNDNSDNPINIQAKKLEISPAVNGLYTLSIQSTRKGAYDLELVALSPAFQDSKVGLKGVQIEARARHVYLFKADTANGGSLQILGGFNGAGAGDDRDQKLLTFAAPVSSQTNLPAGTRAFSLIIFYDSRASAGSFSATLDGQQLAGMFHPAPGRLEKVDLPLHPGHNYLVLSIAASPDGTASDLDRLEFIVPE